jgi:hypothetical protein
MSCLRARANCARGNEMHFARPKLPFILQDKGTRRGQNRLSALFCRQLGAKKMEGTE